MRSKDLGFDKENVVMIPARDVDTKKTYPLFRQALLSESGILGIAGSSIGLGEGEGQMGRRYIFNDTKKTIIEYPVDAEFLNVLGFHLLAGRNFNTEISSDTISSVIVNEAFVQKVLGVTPEEALGTEFKNAEGNEHKIIIGVVRNFNYQDLTLSVRPQLFFQPSGFKPKFLFVRLKPGDPANLLEKLKSEWSIISTDLPFRFSFLDEKFDAFYRKEKIWANIIGWAAGISIFLACMGLFGMISLVVINRSKEIGIRKVNGAKISEILLMLNRDFSKWVIIGFVISTPVSWYIMHKWLENFAYKTELSWWIFVSAGLLALIIALFTVSWHSWRAATRNPVEALRYE
jgi:putative ABC transport system permease protein